uniref:Uncharacterized protein n=1 Tax=Rangifer tarandus platyrhynchus TaxID=3082113 RepID=A0ACB0F3V9_RANTA|nr:unnamed protein product [Rangifer tarandus platyrhynchus]
MTSSLTQAGTLGSGGDEVLPEVRAADWERGWGEQYSGEQSLRRRWSGSEAQDEDWPGRARAAQCPRDLSPPPHPLNENRQSPARPWSGRRPLQRPLGQGGGPWASGPSAPALPPPPTACSRAGPAVPGEPPVLAPSSAGGEAASNLPGGSGGERGEPGERPPPAWLEGEESFCSVQLHRPSPVGSRVWGDSGASLFRCDLTC